VAERSDEPRGTPRIFALIEHVPKESAGKSPSIWAWPQVVDMFKVAGQPVPGPWPPHQDLRPDPEMETTPVAVPEQRTRPVGRSTPQPQQRSTPQPQQQRGQAEQHGLRGSEGSKESEGSQRQESEPPQRGQNVSLPRRPGSSSGDR
jgi:hypothetical protein